jgi:hypothetical protein
MTTISNLPRVTTLQPGSLILVVENGVSKVVTWSFIRNSIIGFTGSFGFTGSRGSAGSRGFDGSRGAGFVGSKGEKGDIGSPGGFIGSRGFTGSFGFTGSSSGFIGSRGFTGSQGSGFTGSIGQLGSLGFVGSQGFAGSAGSGFVGSQGEKGDPGNPGGFTGSSGSGFTGSGGVVGFTGSGSSGSGSGFLGSRGFVGSFGFSGSRGVVGFTGSGGGGGGTGLGTRTSASATTSVLSNDSTGQITVTGFKCYSLLKIQTNAAAWIRVYTSSDARTNDLSRSQGNDPVPGSGIIAEIITGGATIQSITPGTIGWNDESPVNSTVYLSVTNLTGGNQAITVTLTMLQLEA